MTKFRIIRLRSKYIISCTCHKWKFVVKAQFIVALSWFTFTEYIITIQIDACYNKIENKNKLSQHRLNLSSLKLKYLNWYFARALLHWSWITLLPGFRNVFGGLCAWAPHLSGGEKNCTNIVKTLLKTYTWNVPPESPFQISKYATVDYHWWLITWLTQSNTWVALILSCIKW